MESPQRSNRWLRIEHLFYAALELEPERGPRSSMNPAAAIQNCDGKWNLCWSLPEKHWDFFLIR